MQIGYEEKYAAEQIMLYRQFRRADGRGWLNSTEILSSVTVTCADADGVDTTAAMISDDDVYSSTYAVFLLKAGTAGETYTVTITAITSNGQTFVHKIEVTVL
jgi:hypothetical protein